VAARMMDRRNAIERKESRMVERRCLMGIKPDAEARSIPHFRNK
jgi:hypothetical protein